MNKEYLVTYFTIGIQLLSPFNLNLYQLLHNTPPASRFMNVTKELQVLDEETKLVDKHIFFQPGR